MSYRASAPTSLYMVISTLKNLKVASFPQSRYIQYLHRAVKSLSVCYSCVSQKNHPVFLRYTQNI